MTLSFTFVDFVMCPCSFRTIINVTLIVSFLHYITSQGFSGAPLRDFKTLFISLLVDRPGLVSVNEVDAWRDLYSNALVAYNHHRRPNDRRFLAHLLMMLVDLRTLSYRHGEVLRMVRIERGQLPPLLSEYFDLFE